MIRRVSFAFFFAVLGLASACSSGDDTSGGGGHKKGSSSSGETAVAAGSGGATGSGGAAGAGGQAQGSGGGAFETCVGTFHWLQKDAYKSTAGRTSDLWPPHTTTVLDIVCTSADGTEENVASAFMDNHGTDPGAVDDAGNVILVETRTQTATGSRADLQDLMATYQACQCDPTTTFLSLDSLGDDEVQNLLKDVVTYLEDNLTCTSDGGTDGLIQSLQNGDIDAVIGDLPSCSWANGTDFASGLDQALSDLISATQESLQDYHVCNNDAFLQATLFDGFANGRGVAACDMNSADCHGPKWFYKP